MNTEILYEAGFALVFIGTILISAAILLAIFLSIKKEGKVRGGGAIIIGPVPIIFGTDKKSLKTILLLSTTLTVLLIIAAVVIHIISK